MSDASTSSIPAPRANSVTRIALPALIVASALAILAWSSWRAWAPLPSVSVEPVIARPIAGDSAGQSATTPAAAAPGPIIQAPGWVEPYPFTITVAALVPSVVREIFVLEGDKVAAGQVVAKLVDEEEILTLRRMAAERDMKAADLAMLKDEYTRKAKLLASGAVSEGEVARLAIRVTGADAALAQSQVAVDEAALALSRTEVRAPSQGVVMARLVTPGSLVGMSGGDTGVLQMFDPANLQVRVDVPLADAGRLAVGEKAQVQVDSMPGVTIAGKVIRLVQQADIAKNTVQAKVLLESPPAGLVPDMLARAKIETHVAAGAKGGMSGVPQSSRTELVVRGSALAALVPSPSGLLTGNALVAVDVRDGVGRVEERQVVAASQPDRDGWIVVTEGLRPGDLLITDGANRIRAGSSVRVMTNTETKERDPHAQHR